MRARPMRSSLVACVLAGAVLALGPKKTFAGNSNSPLLSSWVVSPAQLAWPDDPTFPSRALWSDDPRYMAGPTSIYIPQKLVSSFDQERLSSFGSSKSLESGALKFGMDYEFRDSTKTDGQSFLGYFVGNPLKW